LAANTAYVTDAIGYLLGIYKPWIFYNVLHIIYPTLQGFEIGLNCASFIIRSLGKFSLPLSFCILFCLHNISLFVSGLLIGLLIDSGDGVTHVVIN
jgi:sterol desaturase/sphingolipid hydroxylase (fatty acid hydroxylase superfamily)